MASSVKNSIIKESNMISAMELSWWFLVMLITNSTDSNGLSLKVYKKKTSVKIIILGTGHQETRLHVTNRFKLTRISGAFTRSA